jgi:hypothetical protein
MTSCTIESMGEIDAATLRRRLSLWRSTYIPWRAATVRQRYPAGHFHSPIPDLRDVDARRSVLFDRTKDPRGIDLREDRQWELLERLGDALEGFLWDEFGTKGGRYKFRQQMFGPGEAVVLAALLLAERPRRFVEVGSGWSTALVLDVRDFALPDLEVTCIEPFPQRLLDLTGPTRESRIHLIDERLELAGGSVFRSLESGDVLFIDSSHVGKIGSDLHHLLFDVFPSLPDGILIHFHDIPWPFEYWEDWVFDGWAWNEAYYLRAFLTHNSRYGIYLWPHMLISHDEARYCRLVPQASGDPGSSIWLRKSGEGPE